MGGRGSPESYAKKSTQYFFGEIPLVCQETMRRNIWRLELVVWQVRF